MSKSWLYDSSNSNIFKQSYMKDFLDVSGDIYIRNGNLIATNDISMNGNVSCNDISLTVPFSSSGINSDVSGALALKQNTLTAGTGITIDGTTINASSENTISTITNDGSVINIASDLNVSDDLNVSGNITHNGQLLHTSDDRLKDNEQRIENALETLNKLKPELFKILKSKYKLSDSNTLKHVLLIDNNYVLFENEAHSLVKCPSYTSTIRIDMLRSLPMSFVETHQEMISMYILGYHEKNLHTLYKKVYDKSIHHDILHDNYWINELKRFKRNYKLTT